MSSPEEMFKNIKKLEFDVTLENMKEFTEFRTKIFYIRGQPWTIEIRKENEEFRLSLWSEMDKMEENDVIMATLSAKFLSSTFDKTAPDFTLTSVAFTSEFKSHITEESIPFNHLMDLKNGFVQDDKCRLEITMKATPLFDTTNNEWISFETIEKCCGSTSTAKYRLKIKNIFEFFAGCSPKFILNDMEWQILIFRRNQPNHREIRMKLRNIDIQNKLKENYTIKYAYKTSSRVKNIVCITRKLHYNLNKTRNWYVAHWKKQNDFSNINLEDSSLTVEFEMKIEEVKCNEKRKTNHDNKENNRLECPICGEKLFNRSTSSLACGHMFCTECIESELENNKCCPICYQRATVDHY